MSFKTHRRVDLEVRKDKDRCNRKDLPGHFDFCAIHCFLLLRSSLQRQVPIYLSKPVLQNLLSGALLSNPPDWGAFETLNSFVYVKCV